VLGHIYALSQRGAFFTIALSPSKAVLPDGRNSHLLIQPASWWLDRLRGVGFKIVREEMRKGLFVWCQR
jgi:hypothetical protein